MKCLFKLFYPLLQIKHFSLCFSFWYSLSLNEYWLFSLFGLFGFRMLFQLIYTLIFCYLRRAFIRHNLGFGINLSILVITIITSSFLDSHLLLFIILDWLWAWRDSLLIIDMIILIVRFDDSSIWRILVGFECQRRPQLNVPYFIFDTSC